MSSAPIPRLLDAFDPRVTAFRTTKFSLAEDLDWLDRLRAMEASVGVILHGTRILEVLARQARTQIGLADADSHMNQVLMQLMVYDCLSKDTYRLLDRLRDLGNKARHVLGKVTLADAEQGYAITLRGLHWYFCEFPKGPRLHSLCIHNRPLDTLLPASVTSLLAMLESAQIDEHGFLATLRLGTQKCPVLASPVLASVLVERLLDSKRTEEAQAVLTAALERFADDVRLRQLQGLLWSRDARLKEACDWLEAIDTTDSAADEETQGILAGAYKRRADAEPDRCDEWLRACHAKYERGWRQSQEANPYLGINAAATALWLGRSDQANAIALRIRNLLETRERGLAQTDGETPRFLNCWDQLTLAEAHLLLKDWENARRGYHEVKERFPNQTKALEVAREQANKNLLALGQAVLIDSVFSA